MITLYGIKNCDTVRKARRWLDANRIEYRFHDLRIDGLDQGALEAWVAELGWEALLNRRGTTWRHIAESERQCLDERSATRLMLNHPTLIKRPVLELSSRYIVGFSSKTYEEALAQ